jgi:hypothetical protein
LIAERVKLSLELGRAHGYRQVTAGLLEDAAGHVGGAA